TRWTFPASCPSLVLILAFRSMRIASPKRPPGRSPAACLAPRSSKSVRHVQVTPSTHTRAFEERRQPALLATERIQKPKGLVHAQIASEVGQRALDRLGLRRSRR